MASATEIIHELYRARGNLFGEEKLVRSHLDPKPMAAIYSAWLRGHGFSEISKALAIRNTNNAPLYMLVYAGHNTTGAKIMGWLLQHARQDLGGDAAGRPRPDNPTQQKLDIV